MDKSIYEENKQILASFQSVFGDEELLFQVAELFPIPIQIFSRDGTAVFVSRAVLEMWNICDASQIVGRYNLLEDPLVNERFGMRDQIRRVFQGEIVLVPDMRVPLEDFWKWYKRKDPDYAIKSMYVDILNFPIFDTDRKLTHVVSMFITSRIYTGKSDVIGAKEYMENHWQEEFDMDRIARAANMSRYHFARVFKKHTGMTPYSYYQDVKIRKLKDALRDTSLSITQAFACCGVEYSGNFAKLFKERVGMTPSQYRKSL